MCHVSISTCVASIFEHCKSLISFCVINMVYQSKTHKSAAHSQPHLQFCLFLPTSIDHVSKNVLYTTKRRSVRLGTLCSQAKVLPEVKTGRIENTIIRTVVKSNDWWNVSSAHWARRFSLKPLTFKMSILLSVIKYQTQFRVLSPLHVYFVHYLLWFKWGLYYSPFSNVHTFYPKTNWKMTSNVVTTQLHRSTPKCYENVTYVSRSSDRRLKWSEKP